ncbi:hypothetical protein EDB89DRAFT_391098 [Lactarius sanguifluus]|nr:hypothetical protein EDB89DRAFT_391098 [Lactarius sanguifluus]
MRSQYTPIIQPNEPSEHVGSLLSEKEIMGVIITVAEYGYTVYVNGLIYASTTPRGNENFPSRRRRKRKVFVFIQEKVEGKLSEKKRKSALWVATYAICYHAVWFLVERGSWNRKARSTFGAVHRDEPGKGYSMADPSRVCPRCPGC